MSSSVRPFVRLSGRPFLDTVLSPHSSQGILMDTFQLLLSPDVIWRNYRDGFVLQSVHQCVYPSVRRHNLVSATPLTVFKGFWWNFPVIVPMTWIWSYFIKVLLYWFLPKLFPFVIFFLYEVLDTNCSFQWIWMKPFSYCPHDLNRPILYQGALEYFCLQDLWPFVSFSHVANRNYYLCNSS